MRTDTATDDASYESQSQSSTETVVTCTSNSTSLGQASTAVSQTSQEGVREQELSATKAVLLDALRSHLAAAAAASHSSGKVTVSADELMPPTTGKNDRTSMTYGGTCCFDQGQWTLPEMMIAHVNHGMKLLGANLATAVRLAQPVRDGKCALFVLVVDKSAGACGAVASTVS